MIINPWVVSVVIAESAAAQLPWDKRGWDRLILGEADRRLYGLREIVGYQGWIDGLGYAITQAECDLRNAKIGAQLEEIGLTKHAKLLKEGRVR